MATFYENLGRGFNSGVFSVGLQSDGKILVGGWFTDLDGNDIAKRFTRLNSNGTIDSAFESNLGSGFSETVNSISIQSDGKIICVGHFDTFNSNTRNFIARINASGSEDTSFYTSLSPGGVGYTLWKTRVQSDGKILVAGSFESFAGVTCNMIVRLNSTGAIDSSFTTNINSLSSGFINSNVNALCIQSDGKILIGGSFTDINLAYPERLLRLNSSGTEDTSFSSNIGKGLNGLPFAIEQQSDGKILIGGGFSKFNNITCPKGLVRLNSTGTLDTSFNTNLGTGFLGEGNTAGTIYDIKIQSDGKILLCGSFISLNSVTKKYLLRLNADGTEDTSFYTNLGSSFNKRVNTLSIQSDGKILVGGWFFSFNENIRRRLVRLNSDGTEDNYDGTNPTLNVNSIMFNGRSMEYTIVNDVNIIPIEDVYSINSSYVPDTKAPAAPTSLSATNICGGSFLLSWVAPSDTDIDYYKILIKPSGGSFTYYVESSTISIIINDVPLGSSNNWVVVAVDTTGNESPQSSEVLVKQGVEVFPATMSLNGEYTASAACSYSGAQVDRSYSGTVLNPQAGDVVYSDSCGTTKFDGFGYYYKLYGFTDYTFKVSSSGVVSDVSQC